MYTNVERLFNDLIPITSIHLPHSLHLFIYVVECIIMSFNYLYLSMTRSASCSLYWFLSKIQRNYFKLNTWVSGVSLIKQLSGADLNSNRKMLTQATTSKECINTYEGGAEPSISKFLQQQLRNLHHHYERSWDIVDKNIFDVE